MEQSNMPSQLAAVVLAMILLHGCANADTVRRCSALQTFSRATPTPQRVSSIPTDSERDCYVARLSSFRCVPQDIHTLPRDVELRHLEAQCWVAPAPDGSLCTASTLQALRRDCDIVRLGLAAPWEGACSDAVAEYARAARAASSSDVTAALARFVLYANAVGLRDLDETARIELERAAAGTEPSQAELRLHYVAQRCHRSEASPWIGAVSLESVVDVTIVR